MAFKFFRIPINDDGRVEAELNAFQRSHRVLHCDRRFVDMGENSAWVICLDYWDSSDTRSTAPSAGRSKRAEIDYRDVIPDPYFAVFAALREWRTSFSKTENVPRYMVFDNRQLADMVEQRVTTMEELGKIRGFGPERMTKYGAKVLEQLNIMWAKINAPNGPTVEPDTGSK